MINDIYIFDYNKNIDNIFNNANLTKSKKDNNKNANLNNINKSKSNKKMDSMDLDNEKDEDMDSKINFSCEEEEKLDEITSKTEENIHYLIISDLYRSIVLYSYDVNNDKFNEII